jgi:hypothetical protein
MSLDDQAVRHQLELAEAELAVLKQEHVLRHLVETGEPTEEARALLTRLRKAVEIVVSRRADTFTDKAA